MTLNLGDDGVMDAKSKGADTRPASESVRNWVEMAVYHIRQGEPSPALKAVLRAATLLLLGGEEAAPQALVRFKELLKKRLQARVAAMNDLPSLLAGCSFTVDELVSMITECAATDEANPSQSNRVDQSVKQHLQEDSILDERGMIQQSLKGTSIQTETGSKQVVHDSDNTTSDESASEGTYSAKAPMVSWISNTQRLLKLMEKVVPQLIPEEQPPWSPLQLYLHTVRQQDGEASVHQALDHVKARLKHGLEERTTANDDLGPLLSRFSIDELVSSFTKDTFTKPHPSQNNTVNRARQGTSIPSEIGINQADVEGDAKLDGSS